MSETPEARPGAESSGTLPAGGTEAPGTLPEGGTEAPASTTASSLFDLRTVIAALFGVYGVVLLVLGIVSGNDPANLAKTGGSNLNLETGIAMLVIGALFVVWTLTRPLALPTQEEMEEQMRDAGPGGH